MARAALGWSLSDLATKVGVNLNTIARYEAGKEILSGTLQAIERVLEAEGLIFFDEDNDFGPGVRFQKRLGTASKKQTTTQTSRPTKNVK